MYPYLKRLSPLSPSLALLLVLLLAPPARADAGLVIENPDGAFGFLTDAGHASVWISHGCLDARGRAFFCENSPGIILTGTGYWTKPGAAAIPASLYFVGPDAAPVPNPATAWTRTLGSSYPQVSPRLGAKYIGRLWRRDIRVLVFPTTADQDRRVLEAVQRERDDFRFSFYHHNCAFYAQHVLELYRGPLDVRRWLDLGMATPRSVELALNASFHTAPVSAAGQVKLAHQHLQKGTNSSAVASNNSIATETNPATVTPNPSAPRLYQFASTRRQRLRPPRTLCETALFDPKYAIPILALEPFAYPAFIGCYAAGRHGTGKDLTPIVIPVTPGTTLTFQQRQLATYQALTGYPASSANESSPVQLGEAGQ